MRLHYHLEWLAYAHYPAPINNYTYIVYRLGFIVGNVPGAVAGAALGNRLGAIRDAKGKSVAQVFTTLDAGAKAEVSVCLARQGISCILRSKGD